MQNLRILVSIILSTVIWLCADAQGASKLKREKPDLEKIRLETLDSKSPYYYPRLMQEFQRNDTLMKIDKYRHLYLGYMFQEDYNPYRSSQRDIQYDVVNSKRKLTRQECDSIIAYAEKALADNPFNLGEMVMLINALREKGKTNLANIWQYKLNYLLMAIVSYDPCYEYITVKDSKGKDKGGFYFNIGPLLKEYYRKHPDEL